MWKEWNQSDASFFYFLALIIYFLHSVVSGCCCCFFPEKVVLTNSRVLSLYKMNSNVIRMLICLTNFLCLFSCIFQNDNKDEIYTIFFFLGGNELTRMNWPVTMPIICVTFSRSKHTNTHRMGNSNSNNVTNDDGFENMMKPRCRKMSVSIRSLRSIDVDVFGSRSHSVIYKLWSNKRSSKRIKSQCEQ